MPLLLKFNELTENNDVAQQEFHDSLTLVLTQIENSNVLQWFVQMENFPQFIRNLVKILCVLWQ